MGKIITILFIMVLHISVNGSCQINNLKPSKEFKLKKTNYKIKLPKNFKIKVTGGSDFQGFAINNENHDSINEFRIWIYKGYGYHPSSMAESLKYTLTESKNTKILNDTVTFKIYKSSEDYLVEGFIFDKMHKIQTQVFFDNPLQLFFWGKAKHYKDVNAVIRILETIESRK
jgi:hypothetical protein